MYRGREPYFIKQNCTSEWIEKDIVRMEKVHQIVYGVVEFLTSYGVNGFKASLDYITIDHRTDMFQTLNWSIETKYIINQIY